MTSLTGIPLAVNLSAANLHDLRQPLPLVFLEFPTIGGKPGRPLDRPRSVTDKGYDCQTTWLRYVAEMARELESRISQLLPNS